jgi:hypothetical protein
MFGDDSRFQKQGDQSPPGADLGSRGFVPALARNTNGTGGATT